MTEKYTPNGIPLTPYERELLEILQEECAEVIQAASKLLRFGIENRPEGGDSNRFILGKEMGDLLCLMRQVMFANLVDSALIEATAKAKLKRLEYYMQSEPHAPREF